MAANDIADYFYPVDATGYAATNKVPPEGHTVNPPESIPNQVNYNFIIPFTGPYYRDSMKLRHIASGRALQRGIDWMPGHKFLSASMETEQVRGGIYLSILFMDQTLSGQVMIDEYQTLGGPWALDENKIFEIMGNRSIDPRSISYDEVSDKPDVFPPVDHQHPSADFIGMTEAVVAMLGIATAVREQTNSYLQNPPVMFGLYYKKSEVNLFLDGIATKFLNYYDAPTIDQKLADLVLGSGGSEGDTYTKAQINTLFAATNNNFTNFYTITQINLKIAAINTELTHYVNTDTLEEVKGELIDAAAEAADESLTVVIDALRQAFVAATTDLQSLAT